MKLIHIQTAFVPSEGIVSVTDLSLLLAEEFRGLEHQPLDWERLFDPELDMRIHADMIVSINRMSGGLEHFTDGPDRDTCMIGTLAWSMVVVRTPMPPESEPDAPHVLAGQADVWLVLQLDEQAERIRRALGGLNPEARRFLKRG